MTDKQLKEKLKEMAADMNSMNTDEQNYVMGTIHGIKLARMAAEQEAAAETAEE